MTSLLLLLQVIANPSSTAMDKEIEDRECQGCDLESGLHPLKHVYDVDGAGPSFDWSKFEVKHANQRNPPMLLARVDFSPKVEKGSNQKGLLCPYFIFASCLLKLVFNL
ncbi:hypothetical protein L1049_015916 [Liquidambar formosana]|uniref:Uncharacterized protein n=1 Tax=Liquidambar formosana TaxID=63359 RepID=A0AAP0S5L4_LIQFO